MKVVIWKSYGDIKVYAADSAEQLEGIVETMIACLDGWGLEDNIKLASEHIAKHKGDRNEMVKAFNTIKDAIECTDHESFENIFIDTVRKECN